MVALAASADVDVGMNSTACPVYLVLLEDEHLADTVAVELRARLTVKGCRGKVLVPPVRGGAFFEPTSGRWAQAWWIAQGLRGEPSEAIPIALDDARLAGLDRTAYVAVRPGQGGERPYGAAVRTVPAGTVRELVDAVASDLPVTETGEEVPAGPRRRDATPDLSRPDTPVEQRHRVVVIDPSVRRGRRTSRATRKRQRQRMTRLLSTALLTGALGIGGWLVSAAASPGEAHATTVAHHRPATPLTPQLRQAGWRIAWVRTPAGYLPRLVRSAPDSPGRAGGVHRHASSVARHRQPRHHQARHREVRPRRPRQHAAGQHSHAVQPRRSAVPRHRSHLGGRHRYGDLPRTSPASLFPSHLLQRLGMPTWLPGSRSPVSPVGGLRTPRTPWQQGRTPHRSATRLSPTTTSGHHGASWQHTRQAGGSSSALPLLSLPLLGAGSKDEQRGTSRTPRLTRAGPILGGNPFGGLRPTPPTGTAVPYGLGQQARQDPCNTWYQQRDGYQDCCPQRSRQHRHRHCTAGGESDQSGYPEGSDEPGYWGGSGYPDQSGYPEGSEGYGEGGGFTLPFTPVSPGTQQLPQAQPSPPGQPPVGGFPGSDAPGTPPAAQPAPNGAPLSGLTRSLLKGLTIASGVLGGMETGFSLGEPLALGACVLTGGAACIPAEIGALGATVLGGIIGGVTAGNAFDKANPAQPEPTKPPAGMGGGPHTSSFLQSMQDLAAQQDAAQPAFQMSDQSPSQSYSDNSSDSSDDESYSDSSDSSDDEDYSDSSDSSDDEDYSDSSDSSDDESYSDSSDSSDDESYSDSSDGSDGSSADSGDTSDGDMSGDTGGGDTSGGDDSGLSDSNSDSGEGPLDDGSQDSNSDSGEGPLDSGGGGDTGGDGYPSEA